MHIPPNSSMRWHIVECMNSENMLDDTTFVPNSGGISKIAHLIFYAAGEISARTEAARPLNV